MGVGGEKRPRRGSNPQPLPSEDIGLPALPFHVSMGTNAGSVSGILTRGRAGVSRTRPQKNGRVAND